MYDWKSLRSWEPHLQPGGCMMIEQESTYIYRIRDVFVYKYISRPDEQYTSAMPTARITYDRRLESLP